MNRFWAIVLVIGAISTFAQMPEGGHFYYTLSPKKASVGELIQFEAKVFSACQFHYTTTYTLEPTPISSKPTFILKLKSKAVGQCALAYGYSGPSVGFQDLQVGVYSIQFDSTSEFKKDLGDTNSFEIISGTGIRKDGVARGHFSTVQNNEVEFIRMDGKRIPKKKKKIRITNDSTR